MEYILKNWGLLSTEVQASIIGGMIGLTGVFIGALLTKISEFIQIQNRREKRASWPIYAPISEYPYRSNGSFSPNDPSKNFFNLLISLDNLRKTGARIKDLKPCLRTKMSAFQAENIDGRYLDVFVKEESKPFGFKMVYLNNGFYYKDYWLGELIRVGGTKSAPSFQLKYDGPFGYWGYLYHIVKRYFL